MKTVSLFLFIASGLWISCGPTDCGSAGCDPVPPPKKIIFALCDFTGSTTSSRTNLKRNITDVLKAIPAHTKFLFYQIGDRNEKAFINDSTLPFDSATSDNKRRIRVRDQKIADSLYDQGNSVNYTCINKTLQMLQQQVAYYQRDTSYKKIYIVLLSDMLENCVWGDVKVNLENNQYKEALEALDKENIIQFGNTSNLEICIVLSSGNLVETNNLYNFWQAYFKKMGYDKPVLFVNDLPEDYFWH